MPQRRTLRIHTSPCSTPFAVPPLSQTPLDAPTMPQRRDSVGNAGLRFLSLTWARHVLSNAILSLAFLAFNVHLSEEQVARLRQDAAEHGRMLTCDSFPRWLPVFHPFVAGGNPNGYSEGIALHVAGLRLRHPAELIDDGTKAYLEAKAIQASHMMGMPVVQVRNVYPWHLISENSKAN